MSVNKVILVGHVGNDPDVRYLDSGTPVANLRMATSENYTNKNGEKVTQTEWHNVVLWRGLAEVVEKYVKKGMQIYIEGRIRTRSWEDKDGNKRYTTEIIGDNMQMLGKKSDISSDDRSKSDSYEGQHPQEIENKNKAKEDMQDSDPADDLPF